MILEDKLDILAVIARYAYTYDERDADGFAQFFTADGIFEVRYAGGSQPELRLVLRAAIYVWVVQPRDSYCLVSITIAGTKRRVDGKLPTALSATITSNPICHTQGLTGDIPMPDNSMAV